MTEKKEYKREVVVCVDDLILLFCEINNLFINLSGGIFSREERKTKMLEARQHFIKSKLASLINKGYGLKDVLGGEHHPIEIKSSDVKKILDNFKLLL